MRSEVTQLSQWACRKPLGKCSALDKHFSKLSYMEGCALNSCGKLAIPQLILPDCVWVS